MRIHMMNRNNVTHRLILFSIALSTVVGATSMSFAQGGEGELEAEPVQGAVSLSMMPPGDPKLVPPQMKQASASIDYPDSLLQGRRQGKVELKALVGTDGSVTKVEVLSSSGEPFTALASDGVKGFRFSPATRDGAPVEAWMTIEVGFKIQDKWSTAYHGKDKGNSKSGENSDTWAYVADVTAPQMNGGEFQKNLVYPEEAKKKEIQGTITIKALVSKEGRVLQTQLEGEGNELLAQAAMEAIRKTSFTPGMEEGEAKEMWAMIPVNFGLHREGEEEPAESKPIGDDSRGKLVEPQYDAKELQSNLEYFVEIKSEEIIQARVLIDEFGSVNQVLVPDDADLLLSTAAVQAIKRTKFTPGRQNGDPIPVWISIPVAFKPQPAKK